MEADSPVWIWGLTLLPIGLMAAVNFHFVVVPMAIEVWRVSGEFSGILVSCLRRYFDNFNSDSCSWPFEILLLDGLRLIK